MRDFALGDDAFFVRMNKLDRLRKVDRRSAGYARVDGDRFIIRERPVFGILKFSLLEFDDARLARHRMNEPTTHFAEDVARCAEDGFDRLSRALSMVGDRLNVFAVDFHEKASIRPTVSKNQAFP